VTWTGGHWQQLCRRGQTTNSRGPPRRGGEAKGARTAAVDGEALRGRRWLRERFFLVSLAGDSGSRSLLHVEGVTVVWFPGLVGDNGGQRWLVMWSSAVAKSEVEQMRRGRRKEKERGGNPPQRRIRADSARVVTTTDAYTLSTVSAVTAW
jgi:hypothetical protein